MESKENNESSEHDSNTINDRRVEILKHINIRNKLSVAGYIREEAFGNCKLYILPSIIDFIVLYLFTVVERFDPQNIGQQHTLSDNTITHTGNSWSDGSSFCEKIVDKGKHHWQSILGIMQSMSVCPSTLYANSHCSLTGNVKTVEAETLLNILKIF